MLLFERVHASMERVLHDSASGGTCACPVPGADCACLYVRVQYVCEKVLEKLGYILEDLGLRW